MSDPHLDATVMAALQDVMEDEFPVLLDTFLTDSEERLRLLNAALQVSDAYAVRQAAHSFQGSCSNMGAPLLAQLCRLLEDAVQREQLDEAATLLEQLEREFAIVRIRIKTERQRHALPRR